jgi:16S rRNA (guanine527-N7)-methyltransferase
LIERRQGRTELLSRAVHRLGMHNRITVVAEDAAVAGWSSLRGSADWVTARSFGPPGDTAECASPFLRPGGSLLVSEPRAGEVHDRWPQAGLERTGLEFSQSWTTHSGKYVRLRRTAQEIPDLPRRGARKTLLF